MIHLIDASGEYLNLSLSPLFCAHYDNKNNCAEFILDEINNSHIYDEFFPYINGGVVLDIGANVGLFSLFIRPIVSELYYVEPTPSHTKVFQEILNIYEIDNIYADQCAIFKTTGDIEFSLTANSTQNSFTTYGNSYDPKIFVKSYTLNDFLEKWNIPSVDFVKMDIEGSEKDVFEDETLKFALEKIKSLYIELHPFPNENPDGMIKLLELSGYTVKRYQRDNHLHAIFATKVTL